MKSKGYAQSQENHNLFFKYSLGGKLIVFFVYVDDIMVT